MVISQEREARREEKIRYTCKCSFLEIYNEQILDLLDPSSINLQVAKKAYDLHVITSLLINSKKKHLHLLLSKTNPYGT